jgi:hypothetical protein
MTYRGGRPIPSVESTRPLGTADPRHPIRGQPPTRRKQPATRYGRRSAQPRNTGPTSANSCASPDGSERSFTGTCGSTPKRAAQSASAADAGAHGPPRTGHRERSSRGPSRPEPHARLHVTRVHGTGGRTGRARARSIPAWEAMRKTPGVHESLMDFRSGLKIRQRSRRSPRSCGDRRAKAPITKSDFGQVDAQLSYRPSREYGATSGVCSLLARTPRTNKSGGRPLQRTAPTWPRRSCALACFLFFVQANGQAHGKLDPLGRGSVLLVCRSAPRRYQAESPTEYPRYKFLRTLTE